MKNLSKAKGYEYLSNTIIEYFSKQSKAKTQSDSTIISAFSGVMSSVLSSLIILVFLPTSDNTILNIFLFIASVIFFWIAISLVIPPFSKLIMKIRKVNISANEPDSVVAYFNTVIMFRIVNLYEEIEVIKSTHDKDCRDLNLIEITQDWCFVVQYLHNEIFSKEHILKNAVRSSKHNESYKYISKYINSYALIEVFRVLESIMVEIESRLNLPCYEDSLLKNDFFTTLRQDYAKIEKIIMDLEP